MASPSWCLSGHQLLQSFNYIVCFGVSHWSLHPTSFNVACLIPAALTQHLADTEDITFLWGNNPKNPKHLLLKVGTIQVLQVTQYIFCFYFHLAGLACLGASNVQIDEVFFGALLAVGSHGRFLGHVGFWESQNTHTKPPLIVLFRVQH